MEQKGHTRLAYAGALISEREDNPTVGGPREKAWIEVIQTRGHVEDGEVRHYQVVLKAGFTLGAGS